MYSLLLPPGIKGLKLRMFRILLRRDLFFFFGICDALHDLVAFAQFKTASVCNSTKSNTPPWVFFMFLKLYKWYKIAQSVAYFL